MEKPVDENIQDKADDMRCGVVVSYLAVVAIALAGAIIDRLWFVVPTWILIAAAWGIIFNIFWNILRCPKCHKRLWLHFMTFIVYIPKECPTAERLK